MNKKILAAITVVILIATCTTVVFSLNIPTPQKPQQELAFSVYGTNTCLRFLDRNVTTCYIPFTTAANEQWQLSINASKMPGAGWTDVFVYNGYWDNGTDHTCQSEQLYPIIKDIYSADFRIETNSTFTRTFGGSTPQSYTFFIIYPPGGQSTLNFKLAKTA
jgi:hypothetical protein